MKVLFSALLILAAYASVSEALGQSCRPAVLGLIVRDAKGKYLSEEQLQALSKQIPDPALEVVQLALAADGSLVGHSTKETNSKLPALQRADAAECQLDVGEITLRHNGMTLRLIFNLDIYRRAVYIDSPHFQNGTFQLDKNLLPESASDRIIPAKVWKKISDKP